MGSRNGHAALYLWYALSQKGVAGLQKDVETSLTNAAYLKDLLVAEGIPCLLNECSCTVVLEKPRHEDFIHRWQLACEAGVAHVVVMPSVSQEKLSDFVKELVQCRVDHGCAPPGATIEGLPAPAPATA